MTRMARQFALHVMALLVAVALIGLGYGHRMALEQPVDLTAYAMPDGTLPELCLDGSADHGLQHKAPCPLCRIVLALDLPAPPALPPVALEVTAPLWPQLALVVSPAPSAPPPPGHGPPRVQI